MGCCLSREDDRFNGGSEVLLPKGRNTNNKRVNKLEDVDLAKKKESTNGSSNYKSPSAVVAARDAAVKVPVKSQLAKNVVENVDPLGHNDKPPIPSVDENVVAVAFTSIPGKTKDVDNDSNDDKSDDDKIGNDKEDDNDKAMENTKISKPKKIVSTKKSKKKRKKGKK